MVLAFGNVAAYAGAEGEDLPQWAVSMPELVDGVTIFAPGNDGGKMIVSDLVDFEGKPQANIFANILYTVQQNFDSETEEIEKTDYKTARISLRRSQADADNAATYNYTIALQITDNIMSFHVFDISVSFKEKGILPRTLAIEKFKPAENQRHKELVQGCVIGISKYIAGLAAAVNAGAAEEVTHWDEIAAAKVVKGMNPTEVLIIKGRPASERKSGSRLKWMFGNENVVIFTDGLVTSVL